MGVPCCISITFMWAIETLISRITYLERSPEHAVRKGREQPFHFKTLRRKRTGQHQKDKNPRERDKLKKA